MKLNQISICTKCALIIHVGTSNNPALEFFFLAKTTNVLLHTLDNHADNQVMKKEFKFDNNHDDN